MRLFRWHSARRNGTEQLFAILTNDSSGQLQPARRPSNGSPDVSAVKLVNFASIECSTPSLSWRHFLSAVALKQPWKHSRQGLDAACDIICRADFLQLIDRLFFAARTAKPVEKSTTPTDRASRHQVSSAVRRIGASDVILDGTRVKFQI